MPRNNEFTKDDTYMFMFTIVKGLHYSYKKRFLLTQNGAPHYTVSPGFL